MTEFLYLGNQSHSTFNVNALCSWLCVGWGLHRLISAYCQLLRCSRGQGGMRTLTEYITNLKRKASDDKLELTNFLCNPLERSCPSQFALSSISIFSCWIPWRFATWGAVRCDASQGPLLPDLCATQTNSHMWRDMHRESKTRRRRELQRPLLSSNTGLMPP